MTESETRMIKKGDPPADDDVALWLGKTAWTYWRGIRRQIDRIYPDIFKPEWLFGGAKHGWSLRYKKSKSFCTLIPEKDRCLLLIVFGAEERAKAQAIRGRLSASVQKAYDEAATYSDGKWLLLTIDSNRILEDAFRLLSVKRKPKAAQRK